MSIGNKHIVDAELLSVCDLNKDRAKRLSSKYRGNLCTDTHQISEKLAIDVINICLYPELKMVECIM